jgi:DNA-binding NarL/FixJ family response regulator
MPSNSPNQPQEIDVFHELRELKQNNLILEYILHSALQSTASQATSGYPPNLPLQSLYSQEHIKEILTPREVAVARLASADMTNKEIGAHLNISETTVKKHRSNICHKLKIQGKTALRQFLSWMRVHFGQE